MPSVVAAENHEYHAASAWMRLHDRCVSPWYDIGRVTQLFSSRRSFRWFFDAIFLFCFTVMNSQDFEITTNDKISNAPYLVVVHLVWQTWAIGEWIFRLLFRFPSPAGPMTAATCRITGDLIRSSSWSEVRCSKAHALTLREAIGTSFKKAGKEDGDPLVLLNRWYVVLLSEVC